MVRVVRTIPKKNYNVLTSKIDLKILFLLIFVLGIVLTTRTIHYLRQVPLVNNATLYQNFDTNSKKISFLNKNDRVKVLSTKYHWKKVQTSTDEIGWIQDWKFKQKNKITRLSDATIVIDPGHGGSDSGALSSNNKEEKYYTLLYAKQLAQKLRNSGAKVYMTRNTDTTIGLKARSLLAEHVHADAFIDIHFDSSPEENIASGYTTYYYHKNTSLRLATTVNKNLKNLHLENRGVEFGNFLVIRDNTVPAILLEMGYINSDRDFEQISSKHYRDKVTTGIKTGLKQYFSQN